MGGNDIPRPRRTKPSSESGSKSRCADHQQPVRMIDREARERIEVIVGFTVCHVDVRARGLAQHRGLTAPPRMYRYFGA